jgi:hypothetical protein
MANSLTLCARRLTPQTSCAIVLSPPSSGIFARALNLASRPGGRLPAPEFPPQKIWPPDFSQLPPHQHVRFEKKYKRRLALATRRPFWDKSVKLVQLAFISGEYRGGGGART